VADAVRELREETGVVASTAAVIARLDVDSGLLESEVAVVEAEIPCDAALLPDAAGDGEVAAARWWSPSDIADAIHAGTLRDGFTLAALGVAGATGKH
jgi:ADP-ribose pyrophosphatase